MYFEAQAGLKRKIRKKLNSALKSKNDIFHTPKKKKYYMFTKFQ